jgi:hypothetical protein
MRVLLEFGLGLRGAFGPGLAYMVCIEARASFVMIHCKVYNSFDEMKMI